MLQISWLCWALKQHLHHFKGKKGEEGDKEEGKGERGMKEGKGVLGERERGIGRSVQLWFAFIEVNCFGKLKIILRYLTRGVSRSY